MKKRKEKENTGHSISSNYFFYLFFFLCFLSLSCIAFASLWSAQSHNVKRVSHFLVFSHKLWILWRQVTLTRCSFLFFFLLYVNLHAFLHAFLHLLHLLISTFHSVPGSRTFYHLTFLGFTLLLTGTFRVTILTHHHHHHHLLFCTSVRQAKMSFCRLQYFQRVSDSILTH